VRHSRTISAQPAVCTKMPDFSTRPTLARRDASRPQEGRNERRAQAYSPQYVVGLNDARTKPADFFNSLLDRWAGLARKLCDSGRSNENCLRDEPLTLKLRENPGWLIPFEIDEDHESMSSMMAPPAVAVLYCLIDRLSFFSTLATLLCKRPAGPFR